MHTHTFKHTRKHITNNTHDLRRRPVELAVGCRSVQATAQVAALSYKNIILRSAHQTRVAMIYTQGSALAWQHGEDATVTSLSK